MKSIDEFKKCHEDSQDFRKKFKIKYGGEILTSVWEVKVSKLKTDDDVSQQKARDDNYKEKFENSPILFNQAKKYIAVRDMNVRKKDIWAVSKFPKNICENIVKFYSEKDDTILDPFAGHNSRMQTCFELDRNYIGYDVSKEYIQRNEEIKEKLLGNSAQKLLIVKPHTITLHAQSSEKLEEADNSVDLIFSSPPYWDLEFYGDEPEQLGHNHTYKEFLQGMFKVFCECFRVLKKDKFFIINVNDFRKDGKFYCYHKHIIEIAEQAGFTNFDVVIMKYASAMRTCFAQQIEDSKIMPKIHEYILVFKKNNSPTQSEGDMKVVSNSVSSSGGDKNENKQNI